MGFQRIFFTPQPNKQSSSLENTSKPEDIDISHKLFTGKNNSKGIIVKFLSHKKKTQLYKKRTALKKIKLANMFPGPSSAAIANSTGIFINENLTPFRKKIMKKANQLKKHNQLLSAWTLDGKIFVKTSPEGKPIRIYCEDDLQSLTLIYNPAF